MRALVDLSTITGSEEQSRLDAFLSAHPDVNPAMLTVLAPTGAVSVPDGANHVATDGDPGQRWAAVEEAVSSFMSIPNEPGLVGSFQTSVKDLVGKNAVDSKSPQFYDLRELIRSRSHALGWPEKYYPVKNALDLLRRALVQKGGSMRLTQVRPALTLQDARFRKNPKAPTPLDAQNIVALLLKEAQSKKIVTLSGPDDNPVIELGEVEAPVAVATNVHPRESDRYLALLRDAGMGPFQQVRWAVYDAIDEALATQEQLTVGDLLDSAVRKVRSEVEAAAVEGRDYLVKSGQRLPWSQVRGFIGLGPSGRVRACSGRLGTLEHRSSEHHRRLAAGSRFAIGRTAH
jgi:hypothetical protein